MLLGKRPRPPGMRRTTSMSGGMQVTSTNSEPHDEVMPPPPPDHNNTITTLQLHGDDAIKDPPHHDAVPVVGRHGHGLTLTAPADPVMNITFGSKEYQLYDDEPNFLGMVVSPSSYMSTNKTTNPPVVVHSTHDFLRTCGLCNCRLAPGRDIYMYRGDTAFCSLECREQRMKEDSRKEKRKLLAASNNKVDHRASWAPPTATAKASAKSKAAACT